MPLEGAGCVASCKSGKARRFKRLVCLSISQETLVYGGLRPAANPVRPALGLRFPCLRYRSFLIPRS
jgi:hypothetical protein